MNAFVSNHSLSKYSFDKHTIRQSVFLYFIFYYNRFFIPKPSFSSYYFFFTNNEMSISKITILSLLLAYAEARFGQEQIPVAAVQALGDAGFGDPGVAATIAGSIPGSLLAAASPCDKVRLTTTLHCNIGLNINDF